MGWLVTASPLFEDKNMLSRVFAVIEWIEETVLGYMLAAMTGVAFLAVVIRRFFGGEVFGLQNPVFGGWSQPSTFSCFLSCLACHMFCARACTLGSMYW